MPLAAGDHVTVRGARWVVEELTTFSDCAMVALSCLDSTGKEKSCKLLLPFDRPVKLTGRVRARVIPPGTWMRCLRHTLSTVRAFGQLRAVLHAAMDVMPFQLEPAIALITGRASRFLLADEVGLGKTIQAGLMLAELQRRGWCERALILTPAGLRRQWADELMRRFDIRAAVIDAPALSALTSALPLDVNPWTVEPVGIASIDFVKQPEVLAALRAQLWDMLIVDEAHQASAASLRYDAVQHLALRARHVVLVTATPHTGDPAAYSALCRLGQLGADDPLVLFRRTRRQAGLDRTRRVHLLRVNLGPRALEMHERLEAYVNRLWAIGESGKRRDVQLAAMVLSKRAFSSAGALAASIRRRIASVSGTSLASQPELPFDADGDASDEPFDSPAAAFADISEEHRVLTHVLDAATSAASDEPKITVLRRLLRRTGEPVIVFTEYRDTLCILEHALGDLRQIVTLHGGKTPQERREAVDAFTRGSAGLLLATDAGAEGLNLHERCRLVVNLELPWNPIRLEQRIGRVDRLGQARAVHAINLLAGNTAEAGVLARLATRLDRIYASEIEVAASVIGRAETPPARTDVSGERHTETCDVAALARTEGVRIQTARSHCGTSSPAEDVIPAALIKSARISSPVLKSLDQRLIWFLLVRIADGSGRVIDETIVSVATPQHQPRREHARRVVKRALAHHARRVIEFVASIARDRARALSRACVQWTSRALLRERRLRDAAAGGAGTLTQPGLFDKRAMRNQETITQDRQTVFDTSLARTTLLETAVATAAAQPPEIAFILVVRLAPDTTSRSRFVPTC